MNNSEINLYAGDLIEKCFNGEIEPEGKHRWL